MYLRKESSEMNQDPEGKSRPHPAMSGHGLMFQWFCDFIGGERGTDRFHPRWQHITRLSIRLIINHGCKIAQWSLWRQPRENKETDAAGREICVILQHRLQDLWDPYQRTRFRLLNITMSGWCFSTKRAGQYSSQGLFLYLEMILAIISSALALVNGPGALPLVLFYTNGKSGVIEKIITISVSTDTIVSIAKLFTLELGRCKIFSMCSIPAFTSLKDNIW
jgi:hypothetical protein